MTRIRGQVTQVFPEPLPFPTEIDTNPYPWANFPGELTRATTAVTVGAIATQLLVAKEGRVVYMVYNNSNITVYVGGADVTLANGIPIQRGGSYTNEGWTGVVWAIATANANVRIEEM